MNCKLLTSILLPLALIACSNAPNHLIVAPEINLPTTNIFANKQAKLTVTDMRTSNHIVQILKEGEAATILASQERLESIIQSTLASNWQKQGLPLSNTTQNDIKQNNIEISIEKAVVSVKQSTMSYKTQSEIVLQVKIDNGQQTLTNTFKSRANSEGALKADIAVLERDFNQNLTRLLKQILDSKDIKAFI